MVAKLNNYAIFSDFMFGWSCSSATCANVNHQALFPMTLHSFKANQTLMMVEIPCSVAGFVVKTGKQCFISDLVTHSVMYWLQNSL